MQSLAQDLRYALRTFRQSPGFALAAVLSLALGVGANTAIFSVASALLLRPLPYADPQRLVILWNRSPGLGIMEDWFSTAQYFDIRSGHRGLEEVAIAIGGNYNLTGDGEPERIGTIRVSSNLLPMLGAHAEVGRLFVRRGGRAGHGGDGGAGPRDVDAPIRRRPDGDRPHVDPERPAVPGRRRPAGAIRSAARGHADARRRRARRGAAAAAACGRRGAGPQSRGLQHHRPAEARRHARAGASGDGHDHGAASRASTPKSIRRTAG